MDMYIFISVLLGLSFMGKLNMVFFSIICWFTCFLPVADNTFESAVLAKYSWLKMSRDQKLHMKSRSTDQLFMLIFIPNFHRSQKESEVLSQAHAIDRAYLGLQALFLQSVLRNKKDPEVIKALDSKTACLAFGLGVEQVQRVCSGNPMRPPCREHTGSRDNVFYTGRNLPFVLFYTVKIRRPE